jgi:hypothetical protein
MKKIDRRKKRRTILKGTNERRGGGRGDSSNTWIHA